MLRTAGLLPPRGFRRWAKPSLLPGLLAATRTGLTPAGDDKLALDTNYISTSNSWVNGTAKISRKGVIGPAQRPCGLLRVDEKPSRVDAGGLAEAADWDRLRSPETYLGYAVHPGVGGRDVVRDPT